MNQYLRRITIFIILTSILSCTKVIDIEIPETTPKIVVNSFFTDNSRIKVHLSKSIGVLDNISPDCTDATILVRENNTISDTMYQEFGYYYSHITAEANKKYSLKIIAPAIDTVFCEDMIPEKVFLQNVVNTDSVLIDEDGHVINELKLDFQDAVGPDYYEVELVATDISNENVFVWFKKNSDPVISSTGLLDYNPRTLIFTDQMFDGQHCTVRVYFSTGWYQDYNLKIIFRTISESYYRFKEKQFAFLYSLESDIFSGMSEPINLFSNITGGYGIFAGYSSDEKEITIQVK